MKQFFVLSTLGIVTTLITCFVIMKALHKAPELTNPFVVAIAKAEECLDRGSPEEALVLLADAGREIEKTPKSTQFCYAIVKARVYHALAKRFDLAEMYGSAREDRQAMMRLAKRLAGEMRKNGQTAMSVASYYEGVFWYEESSASSCVELIGIGAGHHGTGAVGVALLLGQGPGLRTPDETLKTMQVNDE